MHKDNFTEISLRLLALAVVGMVFLSAHALAESRTFSAEREGQHKTAQAPSFLERFLSFGMDSQQTRHIALDLPVPKPQEKPLRTERSGPSFVPLRARPLSAEQKLGALSDRDARLYREIFDLQEGGAWNDADLLIAQLRDERLVGYVLAQRYLHPTAYKSEYGELQAWMETCADYPMAGKIYRLALARKKRGDSAPLNKPQTFRGLKIVPVADEESPPSGSGSTASGRSRIRPSGWGAAMAAWRREDYKIAAQAFEAAAASQDTSDWGRAASAFWASRAHLRSGDLENVSPWLEKAASYPRTFYGLIATRALGRDFDFDWSLGFSDEDAARLAAYPQGVRAMALARAGRSDWAEAELRLIAPEGDAALRDSLLAFAASAKIPALAMELVSALPPGARAGYDAALYPLGDWVPQDGYKVDPALVHAIIRQESRFDPQARSHKGATGLMQLMPATARGVIRQAGIAAPDGMVALNDPVKNLEVGQLYIEDLLGQNLVGQDLVSLAVAYNAGPGNLARWKSRISPIADPLLFIETIPVFETRVYVERVLTNYWIYRLRMGEDSPSLDSIAAGETLLHEENIAMQTRQDGSSGFFFWN